jgi:hypothetical protein
VVAVGSGNGGDSRSEPDTRATRAGRGQARRGVGATTASPGLPESPSKPTRSHGEGKGGTTAERWAAVLVVPPHVPPSAAACVRPHLTSRQKKPLAMVTMAMAVSILLPPCALCHRIASVA